MKTNKIGAMFFVSVLALAGIGITYAGFTDSISVYGTVNTATVDIEVQDWYSGTWVWKIWGDNYQGDEIYTYRGWVQDKPTDDAVLDMFADQGVTNVLLVAYSEAMVGTAHGDPAMDYDVDMVYNNLFPCIDFSADFIFHYEGSIPAKIDTATIFSEDSWLVDLWNYHAGNPGFGAWVEAYRCEPIIVDNVITGWTILGDQPVDVGYQLHYCNYVYVKLVIHLPQMNSLQGLTGTFTGTIGVIQWNDMCNQPNGY